MWCFSPHAGEGQGYWQLRGGPQRHGPGQRLRTGFRVRHIRIRVDTIFPQEQEVKNLRAFVAGTVSRTHHATATF